MTAHDSFEYALFVARAQQLALEMELERHDELRLAIITYAAQEALVIANRAITTTERGATEMAARLEPVQARLNELFDRVVAELT